MEGQNDLTHSEKVLRVLEGPRLREFFSGLFDTPARSFDYKWLRAMHKGGFTGAHVDNVYMNRGSQVCRMWMIPITPN